MQCYVMICIPIWCTLGGPVLPGAEAASSSMKEKRTTVKSNQFLGAHPAINLESTRWVVEPCTSEKFEGQFGLLFRVFYTTSRKVFLGRSAIQTYGIHFI